MNFEFDMQRNNFLDVINWSDHLRVIKIIKFTKAKSQWNSQTGFKLKKKHYRDVFENKVTSFQ